MQFVDHPGFGGGGKVFSPRLFNRCGFRPGHAAWPAPEGRLKYDRRGNAGI